MGHRVGSHRGNRPEAPAAQGERSRCAPRRGAGLAGGAGAAPTPGARSACVATVLAEIQTVLLPTAVVPASTPQALRSNGLGPRGEPAPGTRGGRGHRPRGSRSSARPARCPIPLPAASLPSGLGASRSCRGPSGRGRRGCGLPGLCGAPARPLGLRAFRGRPRHPAPRGGAPPPPVGRPELLLALRRRARLPTGRASLSRGMLRTCRILLCPLCPLCPFIHIYESRREGLLSIRSRGPSSAVGTTSPLAPQAPWELLRRGPCI